MSLLSICQSVTAEVGWPVPPTIIGNPDGTAIQLLAIANNELRAISEMFTWPRLEVEYPFQTSAGQGVYLFPADFRSLDTGALFNADQYYSVKGSLAITEWQAFKYGKLGSLDRQAFRMVYPLGLSGIEISPIPTGITNLVALYITQYYAVSVGGAAQPMYTADSDVSRIWERLVELGVKWRFRRAKGLDFSAEYAEYDATVKVQLAKARSTEVIPIGRRRPMDNDALTSGYVRDRGFGV